MCKHFLHTACIVVGMMMNPGGYDLESMSLEQLADLRKWQLERLGKVTTELTVRVGQAYEEGMNIKSIAKKAGVTRRTIYSWLGL